MNKPLKVLCGGDWSGSARSCRTTNYSFIYFDRVGDNLGFRVIYDGDFEMDMKDVRGGGWVDGAENCQSAGRYNVDSRYTAYDGGFRVICNGDSEMNAKDVRGGSWSSRAQVCRAAYRSINYPDYGYSGYGFRVAGAPTIQPEIIQLQPTGTLLKRVEPGEIGDLKIEKPYYISVFLITQLEWQIVMGENPSHFSPPHAEGWLDVGSKNDRPSGFPVESVSWDDCATFCEKLSKMSGVDVMLPTSDQWKFAAMGGVHSVGHEFAGSDDVDEVAWYMGNSDGQTHPVGQKRPNELGLYDMSGNVWEWCH